MNYYSRDELQNALKIISSTILNCEKIHPKFPEGTSQHSLLVNRIKALKISKSLIEYDNNIQTYTKDELENALPPVISIINKTEKAQSKYDEENPQFKRLSPLIKAMYIAKTLITDEINKRQ